MGLKCTAPQPMKAGEKKKRVKPNMKSLLFAVNRLKKQNYDFLIFFVFRKIFYFYFLLFHIGPAMTLIYII